MTVTYDLSRNQNVTGINYTFVSDPRTTTGLINIELLTTDHEIHRSANIQATMDQGVASFNISDEDLTELLPSYNGGAITLNIIIELLSANNDPTESETLYNEIITVQPAFTVPQAPVLSLNQDNDEYSLLNVTVRSSDDIDHFRVYYKSDEEGSKYQKLTYVLPSDVYIEDVFDLENGNTLYILKVPNLTNGEQYEAYVKAYNQYGQSDQSGTIELTPLNIPAAPTITKVETMMTGSVFDSSNVKITVTWADYDAESYWSVDANRNRDPSGNNSYAKLRIGTVSAIHDASSSYLTYDGDYAFEIILTNEQLTAATDLTPGSAGLTITDIVVNLVDWFGLNTAITEGGSLRAQIVADSNPYDPSGNNALFGDRDMGELSAEKQAYLQVDAVLNDITVSVDLVSGDQTFYFNGQYNSQDDNGVTLTVTNDTTTIINAAAVYLDGSSMDQQSTTVSYNDIVTNNHITATLSVPDRNGTLDENDDVVIYTYEKSFTTSKFKTPTYESTFNFTGNLGHNDAYLHTVLTDVNNESLNLFDSDSSRVNVTWKLFNNVAVTGTPLTSASYNATAGTIENISYVLFDVAASYFLKATKHCELDSDIVTYYNNRYYGEGELEYTTYDLDSDGQGPIYWMKKPVLSAIKVDVDVVTGDQTFYFNGQIASQDASGATLTVTNGSTNAILSNFQVTLSGATIVEKDVAQSYGQIVTNEVITATLTQYDRNGTLDGATPYTYTSTVMFTTYKFKTPEAPSATLAKNEVGNDRTFKATLTDANANNGYDITTLTAQISDSASASGLLADCSGTFDLDIDEPNQAATNQALDLTRDADFTIDAPYYMDVTKSYRLNDTVYTRYHDAEKSVPLAQSGSIHLSPYAGPVYYMGNPEITDIVITAPRSVKIIAETHGTTLTTSDAFTLVLVAKDGLAGYATGVLRGPMGTAVHMNGSSFNATSPTNENSVVDYTFTTNVDITTGASCIGIVDVTNGHSAVSLFNFPNVPLAADFNSRTN